MDTKKQSKVDSNKSSRPHKDRKEKQEKPELEKSKVFYKPKRDVPLQVSEVSVTHLRDLFPSEGRKNVARLIWLSDTHNDENVFAQVLPPLMSPGVNILFHCGDWSYLGFENQKFSQWLQSLQGFKYKFVCSGNHESSPDEVGGGVTHDVIRKEITTENTFFLAYDSVVLPDVGNLTVSGLSAWNVRDTAQMLAHNRKYPNVLQGKPNRCDVFISHYPMRKSQKLGWKFNPETKAMEDAGSWKVDRARKTLNPTVHVFGHVHKKGKTGKEILERGKDGKLSVNIARGVCWTDYHY